jgi:hypothetical protein
MLCDRKHVQPATPPVAFRLTDSQVNYMFFSASIEGHGRPSFPTLELFLCSRYLHLSLCFGLGEEMHLLFSLSSFCVYAVHIIAALVLYFLKKASTRVVTLREMRRVYLFCYLFPCRVNYWLCLSVCKHIQNAWQFVSCVC